ncbi:5'-nucleotidase /3'-nucleotidase /exopolyphosphatase [Candidatus Kryptobacter tengchongensis]|uniref:5'-nucleotidase SurE n=1 Tax=Kryptobacter tengchongensis TaxID=1643429 RepID=A0A916PDV3_KRYT1|nr:5'/3'-nucleotidase SurE [Candidatus Kryptobacter tengchongensis]CUS79353.1 5'-nucleotidase /3'-nucleotidase /exopolyphosphatase [Candidatus Kryptobacter tengchongensis]CUS97887.1 5'-nucleotidase /3'-nucleotidase /exopolyphosphatase [Candidatus Kryptobacter tengchongensis]CUU10942.1 5'-nucleotidase /3'-nucleotidase /exopolyphosphatase [Candidatus Kryptobacter tengchongensis]
MHILVSNDDGINSEGIYALAMELRKIADVTVVAPEKQMSAVGHAITVQYPLRVNPFYKNGELFGYAVDGTPADAVKLAVKALLKDKKIDLLISGINHGTNTSINIIYSGTVSAATEGTILGIPSIAISLATYAPNPDFSFAAKFAVKLAEFVFKNGLPKGTLLNVNVPPVSENEIKGVLVTRQGSAFWDDWFEIRKDPNGRDYYWLAGRFINYEQGDLNADHTAVQNNYISITPIHFDLTNYKAIDELKKSGLENLLKSLDKD